MVATAVALLPMSANAQTQSSTNVIQISANKTTAIRIAKGKPKTIKTSVPFYEIVIGDPEIANVNPLTDSSFYVLGNNLGTTGIALFDENKQAGRQRRHRGDARYRQAGEHHSRHHSRLRYRREVGERPPGSVRLGRRRGRCRQGDADRHRIFRRREGHQLGQHLVVAAGQLNVRFVEVNRQIGHELRTQIAAAYVGPSGAIGFNSDPHASSNTPAGSLVGSLLTGGFSIDAVITALEDRGVARRLAEPNLIARSGERASFLAGGEFPIPVSENDGQISVTYKSSASASTHADGPAGRFDQPRYRA